MKLKLGRGMNYVLFAVMVLLVIVVEVQVFSLNSQLNKLTGKTTSKDVAAAPAGAPEVDFYVMSYCPYGNQAEEGIAPVYDLLKGKANFNPHYVVYSNYNGGGPNYCIDTESKYCSMHGAQEMRQDVREMCVDKHFGTGNWFKFVLAMNKQCSAQNADTCWEAVATQLGLDAAKIKKCEAEEGTQLAAAELALNQQLGVQGSPTIFISGKEYNGNRLPGDFLDAVCAGFGSSKPSECSNTQLQRTTSSTQAAAPAAGCG